MRPTFVGALNTDALTDARLLFLRPCTADSSYQPLLDLYFQHASDDLKASFPNAERGNPGQPKPKANTIDTSKVRETFGWTPVADKDTVCVSLLLLLLILQGDQVLGRVGS